MEDGVTELRTALKGGKTLFGVEQILKGLRKGEIAQVFLSSTVAKESRETIVSYAKSDSVQVFELDMASDALGVFCKRPFLISVVSVTK
ncbi:MAG: ribosomal L7Ae/L30e/S12e/Gadd45 family protein [Nanoarchaeota archaeon]|nr:ribosomal L7Ae/L30e/S12e/Gadd45 family protein [Nanoarchaeota archaeon]